MKESEEGRVTKKELGVKGRAAHCRDPSRQRDTCSRTVLLPNSWTAPTHRSPVHQLYIHQPGQLRQCKGSGGQRPVLSHAKAPAAGVWAVASLCKPSPFGGVSSMSFFWQKVAGKMAWEEAW